MEKFTFTQFKFDKVNSVENESEILKQLNRSSSEEEIIDYEYLKCKKKTGKITDFYKTVRTNRFHPYKKVNSSEGASKNEKSDILGEPIADLTAKNSKKQNGVCGKKSFLDDFINLLESKETLPKKNVNDTRISTDFIDSLFDLSTDNVKTQQKSNGLDEFLDILTNAKSAKEKSQTVENNGKTTKSSSRETFSSNTLDFLLGISNPSENVSSLKLIDSKTSENLTQNSDIANLFPQLDGTVCRSEDYYSEPSKIIDENSFSNSKRLLERNSVVEEKRCESPSIIVKQIVNSVSKDLMNVKKTDNSKKDKQRCVLKKYRKGKTKIYRIKNVLKPVKRENPKDDLLNNLESFFNNEETEVTVKSPSICSMKTTSSMQTDETKSDTLSTNSGNLTQLQYSLKKGVKTLIHDQSLLYKADELDLFHDDVNQDDVKLKIDEIFRKIINEKKYCFEIRKQSYDNCIFKDQRLQLKPFEESSKTQISYAVSKSRLKFSLMLFVLNKVRHLLETNTKLSKREIYYQLKNFVSDQRSTDRAINAVTCLLDVGPWALNIVAQKGLVYGNLKIKLSSYETINCNVPGTLVPQDVNSIIEIQTSAKFILVVEKECIFNKLIEDGLTNKLSKPFIMVTGKGFPDLTTQLFLKRLWKIMSIPVLILTDADPHGINIMLNYKFGSITNAHISHHLAIPKAKWMGVFPSEIFDLGLQYQNLTDHELRMLKHLLNVPYLKEYSKIESELKSLYEKKHKAEIEALIKTEKFLSDVYFPNKFSLKDFI